MNQYVDYSKGPGSIGALQPLAALSHAPTIGANAPRRSIGHEAHRARGIPSMGMGAYSSGVLANGDGVFDGFGGLGTQGCGCMGTDEAVAAANGAANAANGAAAAANGAANAANGAANAANGAAAAANGNGAGMSALVPVVAIAAIVGGIWYMNKKKDEAGEPAFL